MPPAISNDLRITDDAYALYNRLAGMIQDRTLQILKANLSEEGKSVAETDDVQKAYHIACQEVIGCPQ